MYILEGRIAEVEIKTQNEFDALISHIDSNVLRPTIRNLAKALLKSVAPKLNTQESSSSVDGILDVLTRDWRYQTPRHPVSRIVGEIFLSYERAVLIQPIQKSLGILEVRRHNLSTALDEICKTLTESPKKAANGRPLKESNFEWQPFDLGDRFQPRAPASARARRRAGQRSGLSSRPATLAEADLQSIDLLSKQRYRDFIRRLTQVGKAKSDDARRDVEAGVIEPLLTKELVRKEYLVQCRRESTTLCTVDTREDIEQHFGGKIRCSTCGRTYDEELIEEIYAPTAKAKELLDGSHWMTLLVTSSLVNAGVKIADIEWGATAGEDEIDLVVKIKEFTVFFELKDREFGLGDAYPFGSRIQRYGADMGVIVSANVVAEEVKKYLEEESEVNVRAVEGLDGLERKLEAILDEISQSTIAEEISPMFGPVGGNVAAILDLWFRQRRIG